MKIKPDLLRPRWSKVLSDLWGSKFRTFLVVASIAVGVFALGVIASAYAILSEDINLSYASVNPANIEIWTDPFYEDIVRNFERFPGVEDVEGRRIIGVRTSLDGVDWQGQSLSAVEDFETQKINQLSTIEGTQLPKRGELIVSKDFMNDAGYQVGDQIHVEFPDGDIVIMPLVGLVGDQAGGGDPTLGASAYTTLDTLEYYGESGYFNRLLVTIDEDGSDEDEIDELAALIEDKVERNQLNVYRMETGVSDENPQASMALAIFGVLGALGALITILSSSLIINTLNALLIQHMRQIGVMKLVGGRSYQILSVYLTLIFCYGVIALVIAVPAGAVSGFALAQFMAYMMNVVLQGFRIIPSAIVLQVLIAFLIPLGAGFFPINKGSKINVRRAISNDRSGGQPTRLGWLNQFSRWIPWISRPVLLSIRNTFRQKSRLMLTIFTLTIAGAVFIAVFNVSASMSHFMDQLAQHFMGDVTVSFNQPYRITRIEKAILPIPGIIDMEDWGGAVGEIWDADDNVVANLSIISPPNDSALLDPDIVAGRWLLPGEEKALVVSDTIYNYYPDFQPGDTVIVKLPGKREDQWAVVGVFRFIDMIGDTLAYADYEYIAGLQGMDNQAFSFRLILEEHTLEKQKEIVYFLGGYLEDRGFSIDSIDAGRIIQEDSSRAITILVSFLLAMAILIAFVGSIGLTGTMGMNVLERTREIGVMRAIGAVDFEIIKSVVVEGLIIGLITWFIAIGLSFPISHLLLNIISESMMGSAMSLTFTPLGIYIWLVVVIMLSFIASILPARSAARLTINEVLAYE
ncbi:ABC transporter permease [Chloroflexota bacterium]